MNFSTISNESPEETKRAGGKDETAASAEPRQRKQVCNVCGKPSRDSICAACADRVRAEAVTWKRREDKGQE
jgi:recombinational DNA repair protein RecR